MAGIAHLGFGFAAKRFAPKVALPVLLVAAWLPDLLAVIFSLLKVDNTPQSVLTHSPITALAWSVLFALAFLPVYRDLRSAIVIGVVVFLHWVLDFVTWPMSAVFPNATGVPLLLDTHTLAGLGLYRWISAVVATEVVLPLIGVLVYLKHRRKVGKTIRNRPETQSHLTSQSGV